MKYSKYFTREELLYSMLAKKLGIDQLEELHKLPSCIEDNLICLSWFLTAVREKWNSPIYVSSAFRCRKLNKCVGGVQHSFHMIGAAADIYVEPKKLSDLFFLIKQNFECEEIYINHSQNYIHVVPKNLKDYGKTKNEKSS